MLNILDKCISIKNHPDDATKVTSGVMDAFVGGVIR